MSAANILCDLDGMILPIHGMEVPACVELAAQLETLL